MAFTLPKSRLGSTLAKMRSELSRYGVALAVTLVATLISELLYRTFDTTRLSMVFLAGVLVTAVTQGAYPGYFAALISFAIYNVYLVEPRFTFRFASAEDVLVLMMFLAAAMLTGGLAGRLRDAAHRNEGRARATAALFDASRNLSSAEDERAIRMLVVEHMAAAAKGEAAIVDQDLIWSHPASLDAHLAVPTRPDFSEPGWRVRRLEADGADLGLAAWRGFDGEPDADSERLIQVLADLGAAAIIRSRLSAQRAEVAAAARTEQLRNALLSSISHDLRTPLAAILASASSLKAFGGQFTPEVRDDLVSTIEEEAERLNRFVANLLSMTKLESGALALERQAFDPDEVVSRAAERVRRQGRGVALDVQERTTIEGDPILLEQALGNVLENAVRYCQEGTRVDLRISSRSGLVLIEAEDEGTGVPEPDRQRIFEKFYRSPHSAGASQGTGLGLSIAKGLVEAMGGSIEAGARRDGRPGLRISMIFRGVVPA